MATSSSTCWRPTSTSTSSGVRRQRDSARRRRAPRPGARRVDEHPVEGAGHPRRTRAVAGQDVGRAGGHAPAAPTPPGRRGAAGARWRRGGRRAARRGRPGGPPCRPDRRTGRATARRDPSSSASAIARATSCEPSSCTPARPSATAGMPAGSPPASTTPYGDRLVRVPPAASSSATSASPGRAASVTRGGALSAASSASSSASSAPSASASASTTQRGWECATARWPWRSRRRSGATSATQSASERLLILRSTALTSPDGPWPTLGADEVDAGRDRGVVGHPHRQQLVGAEPQHVAHLGLELRLGQAGVDDRVVEALHPDRAGRQLGGERGVATLEPVLAQHLRQHEVGVRLVDPHGGEDVEGRAPGAVDRPAALTHRSAPAPASWGPWRPTPR